MMKTRIAIHSQMVWANSARSRRAILTAAAVAALLWAAPVFAQKVTHPRPGRTGDWRLIGTVQANYSADHDSIIVRGPFDDFRRIKFKVTGAPLNLHRLIVTYDNGLPDKIEVRANIREGGESRQIDLRGIGRRRVRRIDFWYDTKGILRGKATVIVFGLK